MKIRERDWKGEERRQRRMGKGEERRVRGVCERGEWERVESERRGEERVRDKEEWEAERDEYCLNFVIYFTSKRIAD